MKQRLLTVAVASALALFAASASADVAGGTSNSANVAPTPASGLPFFAPDRAGLVFHNGGSFHIDLANGPIQYANAAIARGPDGSGNYYLRGEDIGFLPGLLFGDIAQVWRNDVVYNVKTTAINSIRQLITPQFPLAGLVPDFGGLVIATVPGSPVYFGEWSPKPAGTIPYASTDLNMGSAQRTVWYVGENPTTSTPTLIDVKYNVIGINQHNPANPNVYTGVLNARYGTTTPGLTGSITRGSDSINFAGTNITATGTFTNGSSISGQFYGANAAALAGIYTGGSSAQDHVAFGGAKQ